MKLNPFKLERYFAKHEFSAPYLLSSSDCESLTLSELLSLEPDAHGHLEELWLGYTESLGHPELRQAISTLYGNVESRHILVHSGAEEAIFNFMNITLDPGDHMVVHAPCYQSLSEVARAIGVDISEWQGDPRRGWALDIEKLQPLIRNRTKVVVVNFPHNPTGFLPTRNFVHELSSLSETHGFTLFSDEVYRGLECNPKDRLPALADINETAVSLGVMSKAYGLAGLRIGWIATRDEKRFEALAAFKDYTTICNSAPSEFLATIALRHSTAIVERNLRIIDENLDRLDTFFQSRKERFAWQRPKAGSIAFPALLDETADRFCADLLASSGVLLLPGTLYGNYPNAFRVGFGRKNLPTALERFEAYLDKRARGH